MEDYKLKITHSYAIRTVLVFLPVIIIRRQHIGVPAMAEPSTAPGGAASLSVTVAWKQATTAKEHKGPERQTRIATTVCAH